MKYIKTKDLIVGEIYRYDGIGDNVFMWGETDASYATHGHRSEFSTGGNFGENTIQATDFEKAWLREMIKKRKFIKEEEFQQIYKNLISYEIY